jgi:pimeloyl-ACP methyl ester carboxylesterase
VSEPSEIRHHQVTVGEHRVHVAESGDPGGRPFLFLHGWPESSRAWAPVMARAGDRARILALDLPGVGESAGPSDGSTADLARIVHEVAVALDLRPLTLVGHDIGGMVAYSYLRRYPDVDRVVIMDIVLPGVDPWEEFLRLPVLWHFAFHNVPGMPEHLVQGHQGEYFRYFYETLAARPEAITESAREDYAAAYASDAALTASFAWYRAFTRDAEANRDLAAGPPVTTPVLYLRGEQERGGDIAGYVTGLGQAGVTNLEQATVPGCGHFPHEEAPDLLWKLIARFAGLEAG